jgi:lipopolysaccharide/colanic/teichoic acid biosynthesis glycosyltransferase
MLMSMNHGTTARPTGPRLSEAARRRVAMLRWSAAGLALATALAGLAQALDGHIDLDQVGLTTVWWCIAACIPATLLVDRFVHTPATEGGIWIVFSTAAVFGLLLVFFAVTHGLYSRAVVGVAFVAETAWLVAGTRLLIRGHVLRLGICEPAVLQLLADARNAVESPVMHAHAELIVSDDIAELAALDGVVIDRYSAKDEALKRLISALKLAGVRIYSADHVHELLTGRLSLQQTEDSFLDDSSGKVLYGLLKRALDIVGASVLLLVAGLPMLAIALAIRLTSPGPALFRQLRVGVHGRTFRMLKFRTMYVRAEDADTMETETADAAAGRVTPLGRLLRKFRLDELPQLLNVLGGTMSLIGPRPEWTATAGAFFDHIAHYPYRHLVRPGITGWAQVNQGHVTDVADARIKLEFDLYYVKHLSFALDLVIGIRTVKTVLTGYGAK